jgi:hypothetical protein
MSNRPIYRVEVVALNPVEGTESVTTTDVQSYRMVQS